MKKSDKKGYKKWEKWFILASILVIVICFIVYGSRLIYYYVLEHPKEVDNRLMTHIIKREVVYTGDGLYQNDKKDGYYYKGMDVNNYLWYSGRLFRIISIDDIGIRMITDDTQGSIVWSVNKEYKESYIKNWLVDVFLKSLGNYQDYLSMSDYCIERMSLDNITCNDKMNDYVGLLSINEYINAKGSNSYLNNGEYFWLGNASTGNRTYYVFNTGGINNETSSNDMYYSYGVRPVITLKSDITYYGGDGTQDNPYQVNMNSDNLLINKSIGEYVMMNGYSYRIQDKGSDYVKLIMNGVIKEGDSSVSKKYKDGLSYIKGDYYKSLDKDKLVKCDFNMGNYGKNGEYNYQTVYKDKDNNYVGIPSIGELFTTGIDNYWMYNTYDSNSDLQYKGQLGSKIIADEKSGKNYLRAVVCVKGDIELNVGTGYIDNPYMVK